MFEDTISEDEIIYKVDEKTNLIGLVDLTYFDKSFSHSNAIINSSLVLIISF